MLLDNYRLTSKKKSNPHVLLPLNPYNKYDRVFHDISYVEQSTSLSPQYSVQE